MTEGQLIEAIFDREGRRYSEPPENDQPTGPGGITLETLRKYGKADATVEDLKRLTVPQAYPIVRDYLRDAAKQHGLDYIGDEGVRLQMLDFAFNSGPALAIRWLQRVLRVPRTGKMDTATAQAVNAADPWLLHHALIAARILMIDLSTDGGTIAKRFEEGLESRALSFSRLPIP